MRVFLLAVALVAALGSCSRRTDRITVSIVSPKPDTVFVPPHHGRH